jgi:hypothetical protein
LILKGRQWLTLAAQLQYLCEIPIDESELEQVLDELSLWRMRLDEADGPSEVRMALAVAAVNFAYFQKHDEPFREPFLSRLGFSTETDRLDRIFNPSVGKPVERAIEEWSGRRNPRQGPFRWVGLIREQAGLPKHRLSRFADWLAGIRSEVGWSNLSALSPRRIQELVATGFGGSWYAREFLCSDAGVDFIRSVCDDLVRYFDEGRLARADLEDLPFYRHGFMAELVAELERQGTRKGIAGQPRRASYDDPIFSLDPELGELVLRFDYAEILRGRIQCDQYRGASLFEPAVSVGELLPLEERYSGRRSLSGVGYQEWSTSGWDPTEASAALFDLTGPIVWRKGDGRAVAQGEYLLVTRDAVVIPERMVIAERPGLFIPGSGATLHRVRQIRLAPGDRIDAIDLRVGAIAQLPLFVAVGAESWARFVSLDAVWLPGRVRLKLLNWTAENAARFHVILRVGNESRRLAVPPSDEAVIDLSHLVAPTIGSICLEGIGRRSLAAEPVRRLSFAIWPFVKLKTPSDLIGEDEPARIELELDEDVSFEPAAPAVSSAETTRSIRVLVVQGPATSCRGTLKAGNAALPVAIPIRRARLRRSDAPEQALAFDSTMLREMHDSQFLGLPQSFRLWGVPGREVDLLFTSIDSQSVPVVLAKKIQLSGDAEIRPSELKDALLHVQTPLGRFDVREGERVVQTKAYYLDVDRLLSEAIDERVSMFLPAYISSGLEVILRVQRNEPHGTPDLREVIPPSLRIRAALFSFTSEMFDGHPAAVGALSSLPRAMHRRLRVLRGLLRRAQSTRDACDSGERAAAVLIKWKEIDPLRALDQLGVSLDRWQKKLAAIRESLEKLSDVVERLKQFRGLCCDVAVVPDDVPRPLLTATRFYAKAEQEPPNVARLRVAEAVQRYSSARLDAAAPWSDVAELLRALAVLRLCKVSEFIAIMEEMPDLRYGRAAQAQLRRLCSNLRDLTWQVSEHSDSLDIAAISPREDDFKLSAAIEAPLDNHNAWCSAAEICWVAAWLGWRVSGSLNKDTAHVERLRQSALRLADKIPTSGERLRLVAELQSGNVGVWK